MTTAGLPSLDSGLPRLPQEVLIIDDSVVLARLAEIFLLRRGLAVRVFTNPLEGLEWYDANNSAVGMTLLDISMPVLSGPECLQHMIMINPDCRVAFVSSSNDFALIEDLLRMPQVQRFFSKPANYGDIAGWVEEVLYPNGHRAAQAVQCSKPAMTALPPLFGVALDERPGDPIQRQAAENRSAALLSSVLPAGADLEKFQF